jgi:hypothetical protein
MNKDVFAHSIFDCASHRSLTLLLRLVHTKASYSALQAHDLHSLVSNWPLIDLAAVTTADVSEIQVSGLGDLPLPAVGLSVLALVAIAALSNKDKDGSATTTSASGSAKKAAVPPKKSKSAAQLEIPYDAAARFAYDTWRRENGNAPFNAQGYAVFEELYVSQAIAEATAKKLKRDMEAFDNRPRPPVPPRQVTTPRAVGTSDDGKVPFFAE